VPDTPFALFDLEGDTMTAPAPPPRPRYPYESRIVADSSDRVAWLRARSRGITATDAAKLASRASVRSAAWEKRHGTSFGGSRYTDHGRAREPVIAEWVRDAHGIDPSSLLFHAEGDRRHLATPDGLRVAGGGRLELCEIKTTSRAWRGIPRGYLRQVWWQQYVLGAERTLVVWEQHEDFVPVADEPRCRWVDRDDDQIAILVGLADQLIAELSGVRV
jgi:YqaJ-like viral recombinase domain